MESKKHNIGKYIGVGSTRWEVVSKQALEEYPMNHEGEEPIIHETIEMGKEYHAGEFAYFKNLSDDDTILVCIRTGKTFVIRDNAVDNPDPTQPDLDPNAQPVEG